MSSSNYYERVYDVVRQIPLGRVTSYGAIANYLGDAKGARLVGWALNSTKSLTNWIPAHRVVNRNGLLTGHSHFPGRNAMRELLESEGIELRDNRIVNFDSVFWDPAD